MRISGNTVVPVDYQSMIVTRIVNQTVKCLPAIPHVRFRGATWSNAERPLLTTVSERIYETVSEKLKYSETVYETLDKTKGQKLCLKSDFSVILCGD